jgi:hypothetical protein
MIQGIRNIVGYFQSKLLSQEEKNKALMEAAEKGDLRAVQAYFKNFSVTWENKNLLLDALMIALKHDKADIARYIIEHGSFNELHLPSHDLGAAEAKTLAQALKGNGSLTILKLGFNEFKDKGAQALAEVLPTLQALKELELDNNLISVKGIKAIVATLEHSNSLTSVGLARNDIRDEGAIAVAEMLKNNKGLTHLELANSRIGKRGIQALAESLEANQSLIHLYLSMNPVDCQDIQTLSNALSKSTALKKVSITFLGVRNEIEMDIVAIKKFMMLKELMDAFVSAVLKSPVFHQMQPHERIAYCKNNLISAPLQELMQADPLFCIRMLSELLSQIPEYAEFHSIASQTIIPLITGDDLQPIIVPEKYYQQNEAQKNINDLVDKGNGWRLFMDGKKQQAENVSKYDSREPGCLTAMGRAFHYAMQTRDEPLNFQHIINAHQLCSKNVKNLGFTQEELVISPYRSRIEIVLIPLTGNNKSPAGAYEMSNDPDNGRDYALHTASLAPRLVGPALFERVNAVLAKYNVDMTNAKNKEQKLSLIVEMIARLERIHPFYDANCRTICVIILNRELIKHGFPFSMLYDPNRFDAFSKKELMQEVIHGFKNYEEVLINQEKYKPLDENDQRLVAQIQQELQPLKSEAISAQKLKRKAPTVLAEAHSSYDGLGKRLRSPRAASATATEATTTKAIINTKRKSHGANAGHDGPAKRLRSADDARSAAANIGTVISREFVKARRKRPQK